MNLVKRYRGHLPMGVVFDDGFENQAVGACFDKLFPPLNIHHIHSKLLSASLSGSVPPKSPSLSMP